MNARPLSKSVIRPFNKMPRLFQEVINSNGPLPREKVLKILSLFATLYFANVNEFGELKKAFVWLQSIVQRELKVNALNGAFDKLEAKLAIGYNVLSDRGWYGGWKLRWPCN